jgi:hypothetical protein
MSITFLKTFQICSETLSKYCFYLSSSCNLYFLCTLICLLLLTRSLIKYFFLIKHEKERERLISRSEKLEDEVSKMRDLLKEAEKELKKQVVVRINKN